MASFFTNCYVFSGSPSSGKTSTLSLVAKEMNWPILTETARELIEESIKSGTPDPRTKSENDFTQMIFHRQLSKEKMMETSGHYLLDRSIIDCISHANCNGGVLQIEDELRLTSRYKAIFIFDPLPFTHDDVRSNFDEANREKLQDSLIKTYSHYDHEIIQVPVADITDRAALIIREITRLEFSYAPIRKLGQTRYQHPHAPN